MGNEKQAGQKGAAIPEGAAVVLIDGRKGTSLKGGIWGEYVPIRKTDGRKYTAYWRQIASVDAETPAAPPPPSAEKPLLGEPTARALIEEVLDAGPWTNTEYEVDLRKHLRAYLATRAQPEEEALAALRQWVADGGDRTLPAIMPLWRAARALPVEGRAPDASHEKKLGKKGGE